MAKKDTPERRWFLSRRLFWANGRWPGKWGVLVTRRRLSFNAGEPKVRFHRSLDMPEAQLIFSFSWRPFGVIAFWGEKRLFWIGDRTWKKSLIDW